MKNYKEALNEQDNFLVEKEANFGPLYLLEGTWENLKINDKPITGLHTTSMPSPGTVPSTTPGTFSFLCEEYIENLKFTLVKEGVRNRGGANEQYCGTVVYEQSIDSFYHREADKGKTNKNIHIENGMYLWLKDIYNHPATEDSIKADRGSYEDTLHPGSGSDEEYSNGYAVSRSGTIPHGSTILLHGRVIDAVNKIQPKDCTSEEDENCTPKEDELVKKLRFTGKPYFPSGNEAWDVNHLSISENMGLFDTKFYNPPVINLDEDKKNWLVNIDQKSDQDPRENKIYTQRILDHPLYPYSVRPDLKLRDAIELLEEEGIVINNHIIVEMSSKNENGGILNIPFVKQFVNTTEVNYKMWICEAKDRSGEKINILLYEQIVFFEFQFGNEDELKKNSKTRWPHIQVNILVKKKEEVKTSEKNIHQKLDFFNKETTIYKCPFDHK